MTVLIVLPRIPERVGAGVQAPASLEPELDASPELEPVPELEPTPELDAVPELEPEPEDDPLPELDPLPEEDAAESAEDPLLEPWLEELLAPLDPAPPSDDPDSWLPPAHPAHTSTVLVTNPKRRVVLMKASHRQIAATASSISFERAINETRIAETASASFLKPL
jgi:hypothetical protein